MAKKEKYFWIPGREPPPLEAHSEAKHEVFSAYLNAYLNRLSLRPVQERLRLTVVDGFCGGGLYQKKDGGYAPGSPMIFLDEVAGAEVQLKAQRRKGFELDVDFYFVDDRAHHLQFLRSEIANSIHAALLDKKINLICSPFVEAAPRIAAAINARRGKRRALFFLDQYGYSDAPLSVVRSVLHGICGAEIILTFAIDTLINYLSDSDRFAKAVSPLEITTPQILDLKRLWDNSESDARYVVQNALYDHIARTSGAPHSSPFFVRSGKSKRAFWLVHLSKHHTARDVMGEVHWRVQNSSLHHGKAGLISLGFDGAFSAPSLPFAFDADARARSIKKIEYEAPRLIYKAALGSNGPTNFEEFFRALCSHTPATRTMLTEVLGDLEQAGEISILTKDGVAKRSVNIDWSDVLAPPRAPGLFTMWNPARKFE